MLGGIGMNNKAEYTPEKVVDISKPVKRRLVGIPQKRNRRQ